MNAKNKKLAAIEEQLRKIAEKKKILAAEIARADALQNRKLCAAIGELLLAHLNEPAYFRVVTRVAPRLPARHRHRLDALLQKQSARTSGETHEFDLPLGEESRELDES